MVNKDNIRRWIKRHRGKHFCMCQCGELIEVKPEHHKRGIPKFIKGHNFYGEFNPKTGEEVEVKTNSPSWDILTEEEKNRRLANLNKFGQMENHPGWRGGRVYDENGYVKLRMPNHPYSRSGYILQHRLVMEEFYASIIQVVHTFIGKMANFILMKR